ncbi:transketolase C-terminal domain-containing protein [Bradyrhizobium sp. 21]|uniref:transketolase family protein n=1 Tax=Bradyrhizobium sp. 21 TaxID=2782666 RepID=UPI001FF82CEE|nr:transketolase C-terminal domain-containing protein [Bradyrhizobium sp. 21]MCK1383404.1 transketolase [Bradyrhizobium sp. 21]
MRTAFIDMLTAEAGRDKSLFLLTADLGFSVLERFRDACPDRFLNVGIAEQNMIGVAAGLAHSGFTVFAYSLVNFATLRCFEQIRNDVCNHDLPVRIVGVGGGMVYSTQGYTHHGLEDIGVMRTLPGMVVLAPGDPHEAAEATRLLCTDRRPAYLRLGKSGERRIHASSVNFEIGRAITVAEGRDCTLISTGCMLAYALDIADRLRADHSVHARVLSMHTIKPIDVDAVTAAARETGAVITVEEHSVGSGLGSVVGDLIATHGLGPVAFTKFGTPDGYRSGAGTHDHLRGLMGNLEDVVIDLLRRKGATQRGTRLLP